MKVLITSGGTRIAIDKVRHIGNMSSGTFGSAIATEFLKLFSQNDTNNFCSDKNRLDFMCATNSKTPFEFRSGYDTVDTNLNAISRYINFLQFCDEHIYSFAEYNYKTFEEYEEHLFRLLNKNTYDYIVLAAAVSDYGVDNYIDGKIRSNADLSIKLKPLPKLISKVRELQPDAYLVGFKLLVNSTQEELVKAAKASIESNDCDMVVANDLRDIQNDNHTLTIVEKGQPEEFQVTKNECEASDMSLAKFLVRRILDDEEIFITNAHIKPRS